MKKLRIGIASQQYPEKRNIIDVVESADYLLCRDWFTLKSRLKQLPVLKGSFGYNLYDEFSFNDFGLNRVDGFHFFNHIAYMAKPWVCTFETLIPRYKNTLYNFTDNQERAAKDEDVTAGVAALASSHCKKLIAISESAAGYQRALMSLFPKYEHTVVDKIEVIHPPQQLLLKEEKQYIKNNTITFMMVGHHFYRNGGLETLEALAEMHSSTSFNVKLILVSNLSDKQHFEGVAVLSKKEIKGFCENTNWIEYYNDLPNQKVLELMRRADVGLLPSFSETYGYAVLEFQSMGVPVITTDSRAFPEINNENCGWLIEVPKNGLGGSRHHTKEELRNLSACIREGLSYILKSIEADPAQIKSKGSNALERIKKYHCPKQYSNKIRCVYEQFFS